VCLLVFVCLPVASSFIVLCFSFLSVSDDDDGNAQACRGYGYP